MKMTPRQKRFVEEYMVDLNATQAAIRAGYSEKTAQEQSSRLLSNVIVQKAIHAAMGKRSKETGITADRVVNEIASVAFSDSKDKIRALELLGRHLGIFIDRVEHSGNVDVHQRIIAARERIEKP